MSELICGERYEACFCILPHGHTGKRHKCDPNFCGGEWAIDKDGDPIPLILPILLVPTPWDSEYER